MIIKSINEYLSISFYREIVNELLSAELSETQKQPFGTFLVRSSSTHPDSFALSIKVPSTTSSSFSTGSQTGETSTAFTPASIAHYLIIASLSHGYRINGSVKSFPTLYSLIVHHSVMKEILPCTLNLKSVAESTTRSCEHRFCHFNANTSVNHTTPDEDVLDGIAQDIDILPEDSKDVSDANYPDLLCTLRKTLLSTSFCEENNVLINLS